MLQQPAPPSSCRSRLALTPADLLVVLALVAAGLVGVRSLWARRAVRPNPAAAHSARARSDSRGTGELTERFTIIHRRTTAKRHVVRQLLAGQLTLLEAASWFRHLNESPVEQPAIPPHLPGNSKEEQLCEQVLCWAEAKLSQEREGDGPAVLRRLRAELKVAVARGGRIALPELGLASARNDSANDE